MIHYDTDTMHSSGKAIQQSGTDFQNALQHFWAACQYDLGAMGKLPSLGACISNWMMLVRHPLDLLAQNRVDLGAKLDQAATAVEHTEARLRQSFVPRGIHGPQ